MSFLRLRQIDAVPAKLRRALGEAAPALGPEIDRIGGLPAGYAGKLLGNGFAKRPKRMWPVGLEAMLGALGLQIVLTEDQAATARTLALRIPVDRANQRFGNVCRISATLLAKPSQAASPPLLTVVSAKRPARGSKYV